jgi:hypothetical protein
MLQQLEFDLTHIGADAQGVWRDAGLPEPPSGMRLDAVLAAIRRVDANRLIGALKMRVEPRS